MTRSRISNDDASASHEQQYSVSLPNVRIAPPSNSEAIELNGAVARLGMPSDRLIIITYAQLSPEKLKTYCLTVVLVNAKNRLLGVWEKDTAVEGISGSDRGA